MLVAVYVCVGGGVFGCGSVCGWGGCVGGGGWVHVGACVCICMFWYVTSKALKTGRSLCITNM